MSKNYIDKMKYTTQYIGKEKKKIEKPEELDNLTASIPENWKEAYAQLSSSISHIGNTIGQMTGGVGAWHGVQPDWTYRPDPNKHTIQPVIPPAHPNWNWNNTTTNLNWNHLFQVVAPTPRFFAPSNNGVFFPCP